LRPASDLCDDKSKYDPYIEDVEIHAGFYAALGLDNLKPGETITHRDVNQNSPMFRQIFRALNEYSANSKKTKIFVTGHSLGAALASLFSYVLLLCDYESSIASVYTFGQPLVGNFQYAKIMNEKLGSRFHRWVNHNDIVCRIPVIALPSLAGTFASTPYSEAVDIAIKDRKTAHPNASYQDLLKQIHYYHHGLRFKIDSHGNLEKDEKLDKGLSMGFEEPLDLLNISYLVGSSLTSASQGHGAQALSYAASSEIADHFTGGYTTKIKAIVHRTRNV